MFYQKYCGDFYFVGLNACTRGYMTDNYFYQYVLTPECWEKAIEMYGVHFYSEADSTAFTTWQNYPCYRMSRIYL